MEKKILFLDRDGVINVERGDYTWRSEDLKWVPGLFESLALMKENGFHFILISNQGGISKGIYNKKDVLKIDTAFRKALKELNLDLLDSYYCPHHSELEQCLCRKPKSLLLEKAIAKHNVDVSSSFFIGDSLRDKEAGDKVGVKGIKVEANSSIVELCKVLIHE